MKNFKYTAVDRQSKRHTGKIHAASSQEARKMLRKRNLHPVTLKPGGKNILSSSLFFSSQTKLWRNFFASMHTLVKAGNTIPEALDVITQSKTPAAGKQAKTASEIKAGLASGKTFSKTTQTTTTPLAKIYAAMLEYAEKSGGLTQTFELISKDCQRRIDFMKKLKSMLAYPIVVTILAAAVILFQFIYVLPSYMQVYNQMQTDVPYAVKLIMELAQSPSAYWRQTLAVLLVPIAAAFLFYRAQRPKLATALLRIPLLGNIWAYSFKLNIFGSLAMMTGSGVPFAKALQALVNNSTSNGIAAQQMKTVLCRIDEGKKIWEAFQNIPPFEGFETENLKIAQKSGNLPESLNFIAKKNEDMLNESVGMLTGFIEPAVTIATGVLVALVALSFLIPVYYFSSSIQ